MPNSNGLTDREAITDAIVRLVLSIDDGDAELLSSTITDDMVMDLTGLNESGFAYRPFVGKEMVVQGLMKAVGTSLDTTHHVSNFRIDLGIDSAKLDCYALAQHFRRGEGLSSKSNDCFLAGNKYHSIVVREEGVWKVKRLEVKAAWTYGDGSVMKVD